MKKIVIENPGTSIKLTKQQAIELGIDPSQDVIRGEIKTVGPWNIVRSYKALCVSAKYTRDFYTKCVEKTIYGMRSLSNNRQAGYVLEGQVSIKGKKHSAFTSSQLFEVEGKLIEVATIHARI